MIPGQWKLLDFLYELRRGKIYYRLSQHRTDTIMVEIAVPGERWEVEFLEDGTIEAEVFRSAGKIEDAQAISELLAKHSEDAEAPKEPRA